MASGGTLLDAALTVDSAPPLGGAPVGGVPGSIDANPTPGPADASAGDMQVEPPTDGGVFEDAAGPAPKDGGLDLDASNVDAGPPPEPLPPGECVGQAPDPNAPVPEAIPEETCMNCVDAPSPTWRLEDFQPLSCGLGQRYGIDTFHGAPILVALFNAGCGYCQSQCGKLEEMRVEFSLTGFEATLLAVNSASNDIYQDRLSARCSIPLFQDTDEDLAMEAMEGFVFDMYIYRPDGTLHVYLPGRGDVETTLSQEEGYENVKAALVSAAEGTPYEPPFPPAAIPDGGIPIFPPIPLPDAGADE